MKISLVLISYFLISCFQSGTPAQKLTETAATASALPEINKVISRFSPPDGFVRIPVQPNSFAEYLRNLPLKPPGTPVRYFNGSPKPPGAYVAVVDMEISPKDLQQCADAIIRLRGEYFYSVKQFDKISFTLTNGFEMEYSRWMNGERVAIKGNSTWWEKKKEPSNTHKDFREYIDFIFNYAGTLSLSKSMKSKEMKDMSIGDVFIIGGSPGHAVIVVDMAENKSGEKLFLLAQSYMPAQETQILINPDDSKLSPWYKSDFANELNTPQWTFTREQLKTW